MTETQTVKGLIASAQTKRPRSAAHGAPPLTYAALRALIDSDGRVAEPRSASAVAIASPSCCRTDPRWRPRFLRVAAAATSAPLNPAYRADEFEFYLTDLNAKALIVETGSGSPALRRRGEARRRAHRR